MTLLTENDIELTEEQKLKAIQELEAERAKKREELEKLNSKWEFKDLKGNLIEVVPWTLELCDSTFPIIGGVLEDIKKHLPNVDFYTLFRRNPDIVFKTYYKEWFKVLCLTAGRDKEWLKHMDIKLGLDMFAVILVQNFFGDRVMGAVNEFYPLLMTAEHTTE